MMLSLRYSLSMRMSRELLSSWLTWTTSGHGFSATTHTHQQQSLLKAQLSRMLSCSSIIILPRPVLVNQDVLELRLMYSTMTGRLGLDPRDTPMHTMGYSCWGTTTISNTLRGLGRGKSKCCESQRGGKSSAVASRLTKTGQRKVK